jgi:phosphoesterase RecJ-like protein
MNNRVPQQVIETINDNQRFLLMAHHKPDGDAVGSVIALGKGLKALGKEVDYYMDTPVEDKLDFFPELAHFNEHLVSDYDALVLLDCSTLEYAHRPEETVTAPVIMVIDHHLSNESFADVNFVETVSATGELVFRILRELDVALDSEMVDAVFTSISTDTGSFQFSNVTAQTHEILSALYTYKDNFTVLSKRLHSIKTYDQMKLLGEAISALELLDDRQIAWVPISWEAISTFGGSINITDDIANVGMNIKGVILAVTIKGQGSDDYRVSLRSKTPYPIDVSIFARKYGGGGHFRAAGFSYHGDLEALKAEIAAFFEAQEING